MRGWIRDRSKGKQEGNVEDGEWRVEGGGFKMKGDEKRNLDFGRTFKGHTSRFRQERPEEEGVCQTADGENEVVPPTNVFERGRAHLSDHDC